ncbi:hypothetical protein HYPSUDRAFT_208790 [Hypholoma sublateritium FD-334 SS-4]|uniref:Uncharacterized protein n=1 Tax=Hypholoma sublateritium (strain FD-334 SS-4) TaxID=945553 RepID=A0A0D2N597_HYPSF|nr:hypothetical protein HYPSUDRAFT_208790 [Hypholoma sublateritium FD-334 SS-4]
MSGPYFGTHPYDPFRKDTLYVPPHVVAHATGHPQHPLRSQSANILESSASAPNLKQYAKEQADEDSLPRGFLQPVPKAAKKYTAKEIRHRHKMRKEAWDKLTGGEPIEPDPATSALPTLHSAPNLRALLPSDVPSQPYPRALNAAQNTGPPAPAVHYTSPYTIMVGENDVHPDPTYGYLNNTPNNTYHPPRGGGSSTLPSVVNLDALPKTLQPYPAIPKSFQPYVVSTTTQDKHGFQPGSVVIVREGSKGRWKVGAFLSAEKYREIDGSEHYLYQAAPFRDRKGKAPRPHNYLAENISCIPYDDTPHITPYDTDKARAMLMNHLTKPPKIDSFLFASFPTETKSPDTGHVSTYETWEPVMCLGDMLHNFGFSVLGLVGNHIGKQYVVYNVKPYCGW